MLTIIINKFKKESGNLNVQKPKEAVSFGWEKLSKFSISKFFGSFFFILLCTDLFCINCKKLPYMCLTRVPID